MTDDREMMKDIREAIDAWIDTLKYEEAGR